MSARDVHANSRVTAAPNVRSRRFDDDLVLVDLQGGEYFALDAVGARMWELLTSGKTPSEVGAVLAGEYDSEEEAIRRDCTNLAGELVQRGLLVVSRA